jgi:hypothetical protein
METIINITASNNIPIILIIPIGNLRAEPYGAIDEVTYYYEKGLRSKNYSQSIYYLKKAREAETLTSDIRVKQGLIEYLKSINHTGVYTYDLESELTSEKFEFGNHDFIDYFHFNENSHKLIAAHIYNFILEKKELRDYLELNLTK